MGPGPPIFSNCTSGRDSLRPVQFAPKQPRFCNRAPGVSRRTSEIGIRMAFGARPDDIRRLALGESLRLTGAGVMAGIPGALAAGRLVRGLLYGIRATDPWVPGAALVMIAVALLAGWLPAARAARIEPNSALRQG